jgi:hypothetical protein
VELRTTQFYLGFGAKFKEIEHYKYVRGNTPKIRRAIYLPLNQIDK